MVTVDSHELILIAIVGVISGALFTILVAIDCVFGLVGMFIVWFYFFLIYWLYIRNEDDDD